MMSDHTSLPERRDVPRDECWRLDHLFASVGDWEEAYARAESDIGVLSALAETLGTREKLFAALKADFDLGLDMAGIVAYAHMTRDQDNADPAAQALADRADSLAVRARAAGAAIAPGLLALPEAEVRAAAEEERFAPYRRFIGRTLQKRRHRLTAPEERIMAFAGETAAAPETIYSLFTHADMRFGVIEDEDGAPVEVTQGRYIPLLESRSRRVRRAAYESMLGAYRRYGNAIAAMYNASVKAENMDARLRAYPSALDAAVAESEIPRSVYDSLIEAVTSRKGSMARYARYRARCLGLEELAYYDLYVPLFEGFDIKLPFSKAYDAVVEALAPLGEAYAAVLREARTGGWIDAHETRGKTSGAYMMPSYRTHPYVLLNHQENLESAMTIAHEMGHALHTYRSNAAQPYETSDYPIFLAEVASTVNEELMLAELLRRNPGRDARRALLGKRLEAIRTTVIRQTMFADFERRAHDAAWNREALTAESLCAMYADTLAHYYGEPIVPDELIAGEWMRIPHFYMGFYVYQYATGHSAAVAIARGIARDPARIEGYLDFLSLGDSLPPLEALKVAGVDLSTPRSVLDCLDYFDETLDELIAL